MMEVEYELTLEDISAFHAYYRKHPPASHRRIDPVGGLVIWIVCSLYGLALLAAFALGIDSFLVPILIGAWAGAMMASIFNSWYLKRRALRMALEGGKDAEKVLGWAQVVLDAQGIHVTSQFSSCVYLWQGIDKIATTDEHIFFYVTTMSAQVVPLRAFADGRAFDAFADMAKRYHGMAGVREGGAWERRGATGIQAPDQSGKSGTVEGIIPKEGDSRHT
jgi:YcxB-like protein